MRLWQGGDLADFEEIHAPELIDHNPGGRAPDRDGFLEGITDLYLAFPDFNAKVEQILVDTQACAVTVRWTATGTHEAGFLGVPPTRQQIHFSGIEIIKVRNGQVVARWGEWDGLDLVQQLGAGQHEHELEPLIRA